MVAVVVVAAVVVAVVVAAVVAAVVVYDAVAPRLAVGPFPPRSHPVPTRCFWWRPSVNSR